MPPTVNGYVPVVPVNPIPDVPMYGISVNVKLLTLARPANIETLNVFVPKGVEVGVGVTSGVPETVLVGVVVTVGVLVGVSLVVGV